MRREPVSGVSAVTVVSAAPCFARGQSYLMSLARCARSCFARGQSYLKSLARCARSGSFAIPKFDEEPFFGTIARRIQLIG